MCSLFKKVPVLRYVGLGMYVSGAGSGLVTPQARWAKHIRGPPYIMSSSEGERGHERLRSKGSCVNFIV